MRATSKKLLIGIGLTAILASSLITFGCGGQTNLAALDGRQLFDLGMEKYQQKKYLRAVEAYQATIFNFPGETYVDSAQYYLALSYFGEKSYILAQVEFNRLLLNYPASVFAPQAQLMKAVSFYKGTPGHYGLDQTDLHTAVRQFSDFLIDYPESEAIDEAKAYLAEARTRLALKLYDSGLLYARLTDYRAARVYYQRVIDEYTDTEYGPKATYQLAVTNLKDHKYDEAHEGFANFSIIFPDHEWATLASEMSCRAAFEGGEAAYDAGDSGLARTRFERFRTTCGSDSDRLQKAEEYLSEIGDAPIVETDTADAGT